MNDMIIKGEGCLFKNDIKDTCTIPTYVITNFKDGAGWHVALTSLSRHHVTLSETLSGYLRSG